MQVSYSCSGLRCPPTTDDPRMLPAQSPPAYVPSLPGACQACLDRLAFLPSFRPSLPFLTNTERSGRRGEPEKIVERAIGEIGIVERKFETKKKEQMNLRHSKSTPTGSSAHSRRPLNLKSILIHMIDPTPRPMLALQGERDSERETMRKCRGRAGTASDVSEGRGASPIF